MSRNCFAMFLFFSTCLSTLLCGCRDALGPESFKTAPIEGRVRIGPNPLSGGFIEFTPTDATIGVMRSAPIRSDGTFSMDRASVGRNSVGLFGGNLPRVFSHEFNTLGSTIRRTVPEGSSAPMDIDLLEEEALYRRLLKDRASDRNR